MDTAQGAATKTSPMDTSSRVRAVAPNARRAPFAPAIPRKRSPPPTPSTRLTSHPERRNNGAGGE